MKFAICIAVLLMGGVVTSHLVNTYPTRDIMLMDENAKFSDIFYSVTCHGEEADAYCNFPEPAENLVKLYCEVRNCPAKDKQAYLSSNRTKTVLQVTQADLMRLSGIRLCNPVYGSTRDHGLKLIISISAFAAQIKSGYRVEIFHEVAFFQPASGGDWFAAPHNEPPYSFCDEADNDKVANFIQAIRNG